MVCDMKKKAVGLALLFLVYALASILGVWMFVLLKEHMYFLVAILIADVIATVFVWGCGVILKTASTYDPYWSLQTFVIYIEIGKIVVPSALYRRDAARVIFSPDRLRNHIITVLFPAFTIINCLSPVKRFCVKIKNRQF